MDLIDKYITNITVNDIKYACSYKVHASYVMLGIILTWVLSLMSTILTTLFLSGVFIIIVNISKKHNSKDDDDIQLMLSKLDETSSIESHSGSDSESDSDSESNTNETTLNDSTVLDGSPSPEPVPRRVSEPTGSPVPVPSGSPVPEPRRSLESTGSLEVDQETKKDN